MRNILILICFIICLSLSSPVVADEVAQSVPAVEITDTNLPSLEIIPPDISEERIFSGKKVQIVPLDETPQITTNNYRQIFSRIPGLLTSEVANESFASMSYRGIGDPHESFNFMVMADGIPLNVDPYGYPAVYFTPPVEAINSMEFIRGGAGLLYGPLPGGVLNFLPLTPGKDAAQFSSKQVFGSRNLYSTFNRFHGTSGALSYQGYFHHRHGDGFRTDNSDYQINNGRIDLRYATSADTVINSGSDVYSSDHGEPGGLARTDPADSASADGVIPNRASINSDRWRATRSHDRLRIERYMQNVGVQHRVSGTTSIKMQSWGGFVRRYSKRQSQGSTPAFGGVPDGTTNDIAIQQFASFGADARVLHDWNLSGIENTLSTGALFTGIHSPFIQQKGATIDSEAGPIQRKIVRETIANSLFAENTIRLNDALKITPGIRFESIYQDIEERKNTALAADGALRSDSTTVVVPLGGIGVSYALRSDMESYSNISQGYRPIAYSDAIPLNVGDTISRDLDPTHVITYETGVRGNPTSWMNYDLSAFLIRFNEQVGRVGAEIQNVGNSKHTGIDFSTTVGLASLVDDLRGSGDWSTRYGEFSLYNNLSLLNADFTNGPVNNKTPQYAPKYLYRSGIIYHKEKTKLQLLGTFVANHFGDDSNSAERAIPSYKVWDLLAETKIANTPVTVVTGINNLFDEQYFSRVRSSGIEPANPRNFYLGAEVTF
jgi:Fe(3+) dicitrate transport protein